MINRYSFCHYLAAVLFLLGLQFKSPVVSADGSACGENTGNNICADNDNSTGFSGDPGSAPNSNQPSALVGNPINLITGNKHQRESDFRSPSSHTTCRRCLSRAK